MPTQVAIIEPNQPAITGLRWVRLHRSVVGVSVANISLTSMRSSCAHGAFRAHAARLRRVPDEICTVYDKIRLGFEQRLGFLVARSHCRPATRRPTCRPPASWRRCGPAPSSTLEEHGRSEVAGHGRGHPEPARDSHEILPGRGFELRRLGAGAAGTNRGRRLGPPLT